MAAKAENFWLDSLFYWRIKMKIKKLVTTGLLIAVSVLLPQVFHLFGGAALGRIFLPMHIGIFLIGFIAGGWYGLAAGFITPLLSFAITGMPGVPTVFFMMFELAAYGAVSGFLRFGSSFEEKKISIYPKLIIAMVAGRIVNGIVIWLAVLLFRLDINPIQSVIASLVAGLPGIAIQIVIVPAIYLLLKHGGFLIESRNSETETQ